MEILAELLTSGPISLEALLSFKVSTEEVLIIFPLSSLLSHLSTKNSQTLHTVTVRKARERKKEKDRRRKGERENKSKEKKEKEKLWKPSL